MVNKTKNFEAITVEFNVDCKTKFGQTVYICGGCEQLGNWSPHNGLKLQTDRRNYPQWETIRPLIMRPNQMIQFKVCIIRESAVVWQSLYQNRVFFIGSKPLQIYVNFNSSFMQIHEKRVIQMEYRDGRDRFMDDMQSQWGSSIGHPSNYPLQRFHMLQRGQKLANRSQISSNLMSVCDSEQLELQLRIMNFFHPGSLHKTMSRPCQISPKPNKRKNRKITQTNKIISIHSQTVNQNPKKRIFSSLPKKGLDKKQKAIFQSKLPLKISQFGNEHKSSEKLTDKTKTANTQTIYSYKNFFSEKDIINGSQLSKRSVSSDCNEFSEDSVEDLFGLEMF